MADQADKAIELIQQYGGIDGAHHKQWVLDQVLRLLMGDISYAAWVEESEDEGYDWDTGIAP